MVAGEEAANATINTVTVFSRVSAHLRVSAHPRFLMILWSVCICTMASPYTRPPRFLAVNSSAHGRLIGKLRYYVHGTYNQLDHIQQAIIT